MGEWRARVSRATVAARRRSGAGRESAPRYSALFWDLRR